MLTIALIILTIFCVVQTIMIIDLARTLIKVRAELNKLLIDNLHR